MVAPLRNDSPGLRQSWHPVMRSSELTDAPVRVELLGDAWVLARLNGVISVFVDKCPHRNARLSDGCIVRDQLQCPYHGWEFDSSGTCTHIPALGEGATVPPTSRLQPSPHVQEKYELIWIAPENPVCDILEIPEWSDPTLSAVWMPSIDIKATAGQFIDNFLDFGHFPFVHTGTFGAGEDENISPYEVQPAMNGWGFTVDYHHFINNHEDPLVATGKNPLLQPRVMKYSFGAPFVCCLRLELPLANQINAIAIFLQPLDAHSTRLYCAMLRNDFTDQASRDAAVAYELAVLAEDIGILEHLWDNEIPLEVGQAHTRADRNTVEFRRIMSRLLA